MVDTSALFNRKAMDKMRNPDDLDKALRIANPGVLAVLCACVIFLLGFLAWGIFGRITSAVSTTGVSLGGKVECFLSDEEMLGVSVGDKANVNGAAMRVAEVSETPLSREETRDVVDSDYLADRLMTDKWAWRVTLEGNASGLEEGVPVSVHITVKAVAPISLILGGE